ncbi:MAG: hypothetical protein ACXWCG_07530, partial [Flavitalea sp.]
MKKIYSVALILLSLCMAEVHAQCPGPGPSTASPLLFSSTCRMFVANGLANARIVVLDADGNNITTGFPAGFTNSAGLGVQFYDCTKTPAFVLTITGPPSNLTCNATLAQPSFLPVKVKNFTAQPQGDNSVMLRWVSVFEANSYKYVIQKSTDGRNFSDVGDITAAGNSLTTLNYFYADRQGANGAVYYRLKLVDLDGSIDYTKIIYLNNGQVMFGQQLSVFPNP